ncbi:SDR family oxidoreductase [Gammaproteobacteria bacterium]|jgi:NAD(P)-dependent dehydrogenase (short-subunit alcohol dehydrogenase family)|nr:SDR family oxidoreductase [Gammaproteobacteria bacterium]|tara:strand:+ start:599 stop:1384 length:786 start_codon:yes stop_codon:yes gene_type:complete
MNQAIKELRERELFPKGSAVVIGGSGGIGKVICETFASYGVPLIFTYHQNENMAKELQDKIIQYGGEAKYNQLELTNKTAVENFCKNLEGLKVHSIINATGSDIRMKWINELSYEEWDDVMRSDADGFFNLVKNSLPLLREFGGSYTTLSSIGLSRWPSKDILSVAPKAAVDALMNGVAKEEGRNNIRANSIQLGIIEAGIFLRIKGKDYDERYIEAAKNNTALKRLGTAEEVADAVIFLSSNRAKYITGQTLYLDGGYRI